MSTKSSLSKFTLLALCGVVASMVACAPSDSSLTISGNHVAVGTLDTDTGSIACEWDVTNGALPVVPRMVVDLTALENNGHFPFPYLSPASHPEGSLVAVLGVGNQLSSDEPDTLLDQNQNGVYLKEVSVDWKLNGESVYKPGRPDGDNICDGPGVRPTSEYVSTGTAGQPLFVELLAGKVPLAGSTTEIECLRGLFTPDQLNSGFPLEFTVDVQILGETEGGVNVESAVLSLPVTVCDGCASDFESSLNIAPAFPSGATPLCRVSE